MNVKEFEDFIDGRISQIMAKPVLVWKRETILNKVLNVVKTIFWRVK